MPSRASEANITGQDREESTHGKRDTVTQGQQVDRPHVTDLLLGVIEMKCPGDKSEKVPPILGPRAGGWPSCPLVRSVSWPKVKWWFGNHVKTLVCDMSCFGMFFFLFHEQGVLIQRPLILHFPRPDFCRFVGSFYIHVLESLSLSFRFRKHCCRNLAASAHFTGRAEEGRREGEMWST